MNRGKFVQIGEPEEIYEHPTTRYSAEFIGSVNVFEGVLKERQEDGLVLYSPGLVHPLKVDADASVVDNVPVHVALRPEKIMLCEEPPANGCNFAVGGGDTHCLSRRSFGVSRSSEKWADDQRPATKRPSSS